MARDRNNQGCAALRSVGLPQNSASLAGCLHRRYGTRAAAASSRLPAAERNHHGASRVRPQGNPRARAPAMTTSAVRNAAAIAVLCGALMAAFFLDGRPRGEHRFSQFALIDRASSPTFIVDGPDGALWLTEQRANKIGRITLGGEISEYPIPTPASAPYSITVGEDGNLWFIEAMANKIGRISQSGAVREFATSTPNSGLIGITAGADGAIRFFENSANRIGRIDRDGRITEFPLPTPNTHPRMIAMGSDGNVWFTEEAPTVNRIARITPGGRITEFPIPAPGAAGG